MANKNQALLLMWWKLCAFSFFRSLSHTRAHTLSYYYAYPGRKLINPKLKLIMIAECYQPNTFSQTAVQNFIC